MASVLRAAFLTMGLQVKINFEAKLKLDRMVQELPKRILTEVNRETLNFIRRIQREQMTGRKGDIYLNVQTGHLRNSWLPETRFENGQLITRAFTRVKYAAIHQYGGRAGSRARQSFAEGRAQFTSPSGRVIPKRLFIIEQFEREMPAKYQRALEKAMRGFL
jgi:phage gpG-like protein